MEEKEVQLLPTKTQIHIYIYVYNMNMCMSQWNYTATCVRDMILYLRAVLIYFQSNLVIHRHKQTAAHTLIKNNQSALAVRSPSHLKIVESCHTPPATPLPTKRQRLTYILTHIVVSVLKCDLAALPIGVATLQLVDKGFIYAPTCSACLQK